MKLAVIGAGSSYTPELIEGIINNFKHLKLKELYLNDVSLGKEKLDIIFGLTKRMFQKANINIKIAKTLNKINAIEKADFIITQFRVGGLETRILDERIPLKYGMLGQETNGFGGMFKAFRTIPVIFEIVDLVKKYAKKDAWIINFTNPSGMVAEAVHHYKKFKNFVGVCNVPIHIEMTMSQLYNVDKSKLSIDWIGLNHFVFGTKVKLNNVDVTKDSISAFVNPETMAKFTMKNVAAIPWEPNNIKALNLIPCPYYRYFIQYDEMLKEEMEHFKVHNVRAEFVKGVEKDLFEKYQDENLAEKPKELELRGGAFYSVIAIEVLTSLAGGPTTTHAVNYPNDGTVTNYPKGMVLEISSKISKGKIEQLKRIKKIPNVIYGSVTNLKNYELLVIEAAVEGSCEKGLIAANISPFSRDDKLNCIIFNELLVAHKKYLPTFKGKKPYFK